MVFEGDRWVVATAKENLEGNWKRNSGEGNPERPSIDLEEFAVRLPGITARRQPEVRRGAMSQARPVTADSVWPKVIIKARPEAAFKARPVETCEVQPDLPASALNEARSDRNFRARQGTTVRMTGEARLVTGAQPEIPRDTQKTIVAKEREICDPPPGAAEDNHRAVARPSRGWPEGRSVAADSVRPGARSGAQPAVRTDVRLEKDCNAQSCAAGEVRPELVPGENRTDMAGGGEDERRRRRPGTGVIWLQGWPNLLQRAAGEVRLGRSSDAGEAWTVVDGNACPDAQPSAACAVRSGARGWDARTKRTGAWSGTGDAGWFTMQSSTTSESQHDFQEEDRVFKQFSPFQV